MHDLSDMAQGSSSAENEWMEWVGKLAFAIERTKKIREMARLMPEPPIEDSELHSESERPSLRSTLDTEDSELQFASTTQSLPDVAQALSLEPRRPSPTWMAAPAEEKPKLPAVEDEVELWDNLDDVKWQLGRMPYSLETHAWLHKVGFHYLSTVIKLPSFLHGSKCSPI